MLTWAVAWTIVNAGIGPGYLVGSIIGDLAIVLFVVAAVTKVKEK